MNRVLRKRLGRELKTNFARYLALVLLIVMGMYIIVSVVASADTIIDGTAEHGKQNKVEDGQFGVFIPLTDEQEKEITDKGITLEQHFSIDVTAKDGSKLRVFRKRNDIDLIELDSGRLAEKKGEAVVEKRYSEEHSLSVGDKLTAGGVEFEIVGIGTIPDYDAPFENFSDTAVSSKGFGLLFVSDDQYDYFKNDSEQKAEDLCYAYRLNSKATDDELKKMIEDFDFDYKKVTDKYYLETIKDVLKQRDDISNGIDKLYDGSQTLKDGVKALSEGADALYDAMGGLYEGAKALPEGANAITAGVKAAYDGSKDLSEGARSAYSGAESLANGIDSFKKQADELLDEVFTIDLDNLTMFVKKGDNVRIAGAAGDVVMNKYAGLGVGVILMALLTYVISVFVIHQIQRESSVIGALYALGAKKKDLIRHYITLPTIVAFVGGIIGAVIGFSPVGIDYQLLDSYAYFSLPDFTPVYPLYLIIYSVVMPPVVSVIVNTLVINKRLSQTALSLIRNEQKTGHYSRVKIKSRNFIRSFQIRQMLREMRTGITVLLSMLFSLFILMLGVDCYYLCENVRKDTINDTKYEYMYTLKYPEESVPEGGEACFVKTLSKEQLGYNLDVTVMGMDSNNKYYDVKTHKGKSFITVSQSVVERYGVAKGDKFILTDDATSMDYAFTVEDICDERGGLMVFMDIDSMRELFGEGDTYYNCLLSDKKLDIDEGRLYSTTTKSDIERSAAVFTDLMMSMIVMLIAVAVIIFCSVMFLMLNVTIERASFGISLVKVFGYKTKDVKKLYLNGNAIIITLGALIEIPLSKMFMDKVFPVFIPNVTSGINLAFPWYAYVIIFAGVMATYFIITSILVRKLGKITPAEVLKNRE